MDQGPLVREEIDAGDSLIREFDKYLPVKAAFWLKSSDDEYRYLYIASERIDDNNVDLAYGEILRIAAALKSPYLDPFRVKLISANDALAKAATGIQERYPARIPTRLGGSSFGGTNVEDVFIYSPQLPTAP